MFTKCIKVLVLGLTLSSASFALPTHKLSCTASKYSGCSGNPVLQNLNLTIDPTNNTFQWEGQYSACFVAYKISATGEMNVRESHDGTITWLGLTATEETVSSFEGSVISTSSFPRSFAQISLFNASLTGTIMDLSAVSSVSDNQLLTLDLTCQTVE
jgi:hypothetical protein